MSLEEEVPEPRAYQAVVFRDFFVARLRFPCKGFVGDVLTLFNIEIHQLMPNAFARLSIFVMSSKMMGCTPSANCFAQFYEMQLAKKKVTHPETRKKKNMLNMGPTNSSQRRPVGLRPWFQPFGISGHDGRTSGFTIVSVEIPA